MRRLLSCIALFLCVSFSLEAYNRNDAVAYARKLAKGANHKCGSYSSCTRDSYWGSEVREYALQGGDCANFQSMLSSWR